MKPHSWGAYASLATSSPGVGKGLLLAAALLLVACTSPPLPLLGERGPEEEGSALVERRLSLMGTSLDIAVEAADRQAALAASERAVAALEAAEARLSTWREDTELARLNRAPVGERIALSPELTADLAAARVCWEETGGAFDPAVGPLVRVWGLRTGARLPDPEELLQALAASHPDGFRLERGTAVRERADLLIEEGGFGKGAGLADALEALAGMPAVSRASLDLGGQVAVLSRTGEPWAVPVADPRRRDRSVVELAIGRGSVSTSGNSERGIVAGGEHLGHLLDPRTGRPAPDFGSLTVWTEAPLRADCLSTGLYVMGPEAALAWAGRRRGVEVLVLRPRGSGLEAMATQGLAGKLRALAADVDVRFWSLEDALPAQPGG